MIWVVIKCWLVVFGFFVYLHFLLIGLVFCDNIYVIRVTAQLVHSSEQVTAVLHSNALPHGYAHLPQESRVTCELLSLKQYTPDCHSWQEIYILNLNIIDWSYPSEIVEGSGVCDLRQVCDNHLQTLFLQFTGQTQHLLGPFHLRQAANQLLVATQHRYYTLHRLKQIVMLPTYPAPSKKHLHRHTVSFIESIFPASHTGCTVSDCTFPSVIQYASAVVYIKAGNQEGKNPVLYNYTWLTAAAEVLGLCVCVREF